MAYVDDMRLSNIGRRENVSMIMAICNKDMAQDTVYEPRAMQSAVLPNREILIRFPFLS
jgi:hypothetical protein